MDFRKEYCAWCKFRTRPVEECSGCPRYISRGGALDAMEFCRVCINRDNPELEVFCRTNRFYQEDSEEPFECYKFCPER